MNTSNDVELVRLLKGYINHQQSVSSANFVISPSNKTMIKLTRGRKEALYKTSVNYYDLYTAQSTPGNGQGYFGKINAHPLQDFPYEFQSTSPRTGKHTLKVRKHEEKFSIEIWNTAGMIDSVEISSKVEFVYNDNVFGSFSWSNSEDNVVFVAEKKKPKAAALGELNLDATNENVDKDVGNYLKNAEEPESFGEGLQTKIEPEVWIFDVLEKKLRKVANINYDSVYPCYPTFYKDEGLVYTGLQIQSQKLGLRACMNHAQSIYFIPKIKREEPTPNKKFEKEEKPQEPVMLADDERPVNLTPEHFVAIRPIFNHDYSRLVFFSVKEKFCEHMTCMELSSVDMSFLSEQNKLHPEIHTIVKRVLNNEEHFNGIYGYHDLIYLAGFVGTKPETEQFVFPTLYRGRSTIVIYDFAKKGLKVLRDSKEIHSAGILDTHPVHGLIYSVATVGRLREVKYSSFEDLFSIKLLSESNGSEPTNNSSIVLYDLTRDEQETLDPQLVSLYAKIEQTTAHFIRIDNGAEGMLFLPPGLSKEDGKKLPLVLVIHGGPHGMGVYLPSSTYDAGLFLNNDYAVFSPNYRGSAGFGLNFIRGTVGASGTHEVEDVIQLIDKIIADHGDIIDEERIGVTGFSYGGFLSCWLAVHPEFCKRLKVSVPVNPVTFMPEMVSTSDIPDWVFAESLSKERYFKFDYSDEDLLGFHQSSPLRLSKNVQCALLMVIGQADLRVPPSNGRYMYRALKHLGKKNIDFLSYKGENHGLPGFEASSHFLISLVRWFKKYL
jgi:pimeloyl-ACP methyl ester carboxylesterase